MPRLSRLARYRKSLAMRMVERRKEIRSRVTENSENEPSTSASVDLCDEDFGDEVSDMNNFENSYGDKETIPTLQIRREIIHEVNKTLEDNYRSDYGNLQSHEKTRNVVCNEEVFTNLFNKFSGACEQCLGSLELKIFEHKGTCVNEFEVKCKLCKRVYEKTTPKSLDSPVMTEQNMNLVYESLEDGRGYAGYSKVCGHMNIKPLNTNGYYKVKDQIGKVIFRQFSSLSRNVKECLIAHYAKLGRVPDENGILDCDVSFDGSWQKRGHKSHIGTASVICCFTGFVLDFHVLSNHCKHCTIAQNKRNRGKMTEEAYEDWKRNHTECDKNFDGESAAMEAEAAVVLWSRSVEHFGLRYIVLVGDGDSSAYKSVTSMNNGSGPYGRSKPVEKQECINHVGKRLGSRLRKLRNDMWEEKTYKSGKKYKHKLLSGKHRLTDSVINSLSSYYGTAIRNCAGKTLEEIRRSILSSYFHCSSSDEDQRHHLCPKGPKSWCFYNAALALGKQPKSHSEMQVYFKLNKEERLAVLQIYNELSTDELLKKCITKRTQNPNEALHSKMWNRLLKTKYEGLKTAQESVCLTINIHNFGYRDGSPIYEFGFKSIPERVVKMLEKRDMDSMRQAKLAVKSKCQTSTQDDEDSDRTTPSPGPSKKRRKRSTEDLNYSPGGF